MAGFRRDKILIGITGDMGSGKSTVSYYFKDLGAKVIDADKIGHSVLLNKEIQKKIVSRFGDNVLVHGHIARERLARIAFSSRNRLRTLCRITHPLILKKIRKMAGTDRKKIVVIDAPLLIESGFHKKMDKVIVVKSTRRNILNRCAKLGYSKKEALTRLNSQMPLLRKLKYADFVVDNNKPKKETLSQVKEIWKKLSLAA